MKIIKHGTYKKEIWLYRPTCETCGCIFELSDKELAPIPEGLAYSRSNPCRGSKLCPDCNKEVLIYNKDRSGVESEEASYCGNNNGETWREFVTNPENIKSVISEHKEEIANHIAHCDPINMPEGFKLSYVKYEEPEFTCPCCGSHDYTIGNFGDPGFNDNFRVECNNCDYTSPDINCSDYGEALIMLKQYLKLKSKEENKDE